MNSIGLLLFVKIVSLEHWKSNSRVLWSGRSESSRAHTGLRGVCAPTDLRKVQLWRLIARYNALWSKTFRLGHQRQSSPSVRMTYTSWATTHQPMMIVMSPRGKPLCHNWCWGHVRTYELVTLLVVVTRRRWVANYSDSDLIQMFYLILTSV